MGGEGLGGPDPRTFENRAGRPPPPDSRMKWPKSGIFPIFRVFWGRLATLPTIRPPPPLKNRGDAPAALPVLIFDLLHEKRISKFQLYTYYDLVKRRFNPISGRGVVFIHPSDFS